MSGISVIYPTGLDKLVFQCEDCNRNFKNEKGLKIHRTRIHGLMDCVNHFPPKLKKEEGKIKQSIKIHLLQLIV
jgi:hypothetical protein